MVEVTRIFAVLRNTKNSKEISRTELGNATLKDCWMPAVKYSTLVNKAYQIYRPKHTQYISLETEVGKADRTWINPTYNAALFE